MNINIHELTFRNRYNYLMNGDDKIDITEHIDKHLIVHGDIYFNIFPIINALQIDFYLDNINDYTKKKLCTIYMGFELDIFTIRYQLIELKDKRKRLLTIDKLIT